MRRKNHEKQDPKGEKWRFLAYFATFILERL
jgi:hypothetical protein